MTAWARVHLKPPKNDANIIKIKPNKLNCVEWYVNKNKPNAMHKTIAIIDRLLKENA